MATHRIRSTALPVLAPVAPVPSRPHALALAAATAVLLGAVTAAHAQAAPDGVEPAAALGPVTINSAGSRAGVAGFGDTPLAKLPLQAQVVTQEQMRDRGAQHLADLVSLDASISDSYNAAGYWDFLSVRGFTLDNKHNYRRDGLPINAETILQLDNKSRVEVLKGTSGMQAGVSAPGGLVNLAVKRPDGPVRSVTVGARSAHTYGASADIGNRFGTDQAFGLRVNVAAERLDPALRSAQGQRNLLAVAGDVRLPGGTLLEAEVEHTHSSQPSQPGFSMLGNTLPSAGSIDPRINLNNQPWSQPVVMGGTTGSVRLTQPLAAGWKATLHAGTQQLRTDDRLAFPFGCSAEGNFDRYCSNGTFDVYAFQSDNERRRTDALNAQVDGQFATGSWQHQVSMGVLASRFSLRTQARVDDAITLATPGSIDGLTVIPTSDLAGLGTVPNTDRTERTTELFARDQARLTQQTTAWLGLRHTRITVDSRLTDGTLARPAESQTFNSPWLALSHELAPGRMVYASWGTGIEVPVTPSRSGYGVDAGRPLPAARSYQSELGYKARPSDALAYGLTYFHIRQPYVNDTGATFLVDGEQRRRGLEADTTLNWQAWRFDASAMWLDAERRGSSNPANDGLRPANVPARTLKAQARYRVAQLPGLDLQAGLVHEGNRMVLPDNSVSIPSWTRLDLGTKYSQRLGETTLTWRAGVDNATNRRAWRESPFQYGHVYLYPMAPRTWRVSLQADL